MTLSVRQTHDESTTAQATAAWLVRMRRELRLSQKQAAVAAGVSRNTISSWERARTVPTLTQFERLRIYEKNQRRARGMR